MLQQKLKQPSEEEKRSHLLQRALSIVSDEEQAPAAEEDGHLLLEQSCVEDADNFGRLRVEALGYKTDPGAHNVLSNGIDFLESITKSARKGDWKGTKKAIARRLILWSLRSQNLVPAGRLSQVDDEIHLETSNSKWESWWKCKTKIKQSLHRTQPSSFGQRHFFSGSSKKTREGRSKRRDTYTERTRDTLNFKGKEQIVYEKLNDKLQEVGEGECESNEIRLGENSVSVCRFPGSKIELPADLCPLDSRPDGTVRCLARPGRGQSPEARTTAQGTLSGEREPYLRSKAQQRP